MMIASLQRSRDAVMYNDCFTSNYEKAVAKISIRFQFYGELVFKLFKFGIHSLTYLAQFPYFITGIIYKVK